MARSSAKSTRRHGDVFEGAGLDLLVEFDREELQALVNRFEAGHFEAGHQAGPPW